MTQRVVAIAAIGTGLPWLLRTLLSTPTLTSAIDGVIVSAPNAIWPIGLGFAGGGRGTG